jgi:hypothetical protein
MESIFKMAILRLSTRQSEPTILNFWILTEDYTRINDTYGFFALLPISSEIELELGPSQTKIFLIILHHF